MKTPMIAKRAILMSEVVGSSHVAEWLELQEPLSIEFLDKVFDCARLFDKKQHDYGSENIAKFGDFGTIVRMSDKIERLANLYKRKSRRVRNESIEDTLRDIVNYGIITLMWRDGKWPK